MSSSLFNVTVMNFENIVIYPPDNYKFLNFVPSVINLYTFRKENLKIVWRSPLKVTLEFQGNTEIYRTTFSTKYTSSIIIMHFRGPLHKTFTG